MTGALPPDAISGIIAKVYRAFNDRDIDGVFVHLAPGVDWENGTTGGRVIGRDALRSYWTEQWKDLDPKVEPMRIDVEDDGSVHVRVDQLVRDRAGNILVNREVEHVFEFDGPFITRMTVDDAPPEADEEDEE